VNVKLHDDVHHFIKTRKNIDPNKHNAIRYLKKRIHEWWNDEEEDDEHDVKRMKHIFSVLRKHT